jgi:hypothetical protein|eukprot:COSAG01_NODE_3483_length_6022_cov_36.146041_4_plen_103_part_00
MLGEPRHHTHGAHTHAHAMMHTRPRVPSGRLDRSGMLLVAAHSSIPRTSWPTPLSTISSPCSDTHFDLIFTSFLITLAPLCHASFMLLMAAQTTVWHQHSSA